MATKPYYILLAIFSIILGPAWAGGDYFSQRPSSQPDFLPGSEAFVLDALAVDHKTIEARWLIAPGYYLYKHRLQVQAMDPEGLPMTWSAPLGEAYEDEHFGSVEIYRDTLSLPIEVATTATSVTLKIAYQGCADAGLCYPPSSQTFTLDIPAANSHSAQ